MELEAILNELSDGVYGTLANSRGLMHNTGGHALNTVYRRASAAPAGSTTLARARSPRSSTGATRRALASTTLASARCLSATRRFAGAAAAGSAATSA